MDQLVLECQGRVPSKLPTVFHERRQTVNAIVSNPQDLYNAVHEFLAADTITACILLMCVGAGSHNPRVAPLPSRDAKCSREQVAAADLDPFFHLACTVLQRAQEQHIEPVRKECATDVFARLSPSFVYFNNTTVISLARAVKHIAMATGRFRQGLKYLLGAMPRFCPQPNALTPLHADVCQLCVLAPTR